VTAIVPAAVSAGDPIGGCPAGWGADWFLVYPIHQPQAADHQAVEASRVMVDVP